MLLLYLLFFKSSGTSALFDVLQNTDNAQSGLLFLFNMTSDTLLEEGVDGSPSPP